MDCPCSALAINCCQLGCFIPDVPDVEYGVSNESWMSSLTSTKPDAKLRDLCIPGSHDSATTTIEKKKLFSAAGRTQNGSVLEQLQRGVRYLDVRVAGDGDDPRGVSIYHGFLVGKTLQFVLDQVKRFLDDHPGEFIFLEIVHEYGRDFSPEQRKNALERVQSTLGDKIYVDRDLTEVLHGKTLKQLQDQQLQVAVLVHPRIYNFDLDVTYSEDHILKTYGYFNSHRWMRSRWHNTRDQSKLLEWNLDELNKYKEDRNVIINNQFVLTPGVGGAADVVNLLFGKASLRPVSFATSLYRKDFLDSFLREHAEDPWNIIMLDYIDLCPALISFMIGLNFPQNLKILSAAAHPGGEGVSTDVTSKVQAHVKRNKVLFLVNIQQDLGLDYEEGKLTIAYQLGGKKHHVLDVDFDASTEILVGEYSHNEGDFVQIDTAKHPNEGVYFNGKIVSKEEFDAGYQQGPALAYRTEDSGLAFVIAK